MRTTLDLDESVLAAARAMARDERISLGDAVSRMARRGLTASAPVADGFPTFEAARDAPPLHLDVVNAVRDGV
ncbi:MAG: CopG family transcriptional regulator [Micrococcales bacterium]|nr:CopG family transcriptional regulator [Micrococcales bacterium]